ncbi:fibronectin type III domain-containing protein [Flavobacteriaceae bacterium]|nr:fibronectin type III domain-containing protein [Flavobacteriaceae bacterium]
MKKLHTILVVLLITATTFAQAPEKMSYQAVVRDSGDALVTNQAVGMQISILQTTATGTAVYVETQTLTTNANGLVSIEIGMGSVVSGDFSALDWYAGPYFIKTETDATGGSGYTITGTSELLSVPYALHANNGVSIGSNIGEMLYWDGSKWVTLGTTTNEGATLQMIGGVPTWVGGTPPPSTPDAPTIGTAIAGDGQVTVSFTAPSSNGGSSITSYTATSNPGNITGTVNQSGSGSITVTGLTNGTAYTFTVTATNAIGTSLESAASNSVTPVAPTVPDAPTIGTANAGDGQVTVSFTAPSSDGGSSITYYTATSNPGNITGTVNQSGSGSITVTGLTNGTAYNFTVTATNAVGTSEESAASNSVTPALAIGSTYQGGIIFYLDGNGGGLIAAPSDQGNGSTWGCYEYFLGITNSAVGTGSANTAAHLIACPFFGTAAKIAADLTLGGYDDWFLPSKDELNLMYENIGPGNALGLGNIGNFYPARYWSSTEINSLAAWRIYFGSSTGEADWNKSTTYLVRAVRAF